MEKEQKWARMKEEKEGKIKTLKNCDEKKTVTYEKKKQFEDDKHEHMKHLDFLKLERNKILQQNKIAQQNLVKNQFKIEVEIGWVVSSRFWFNFGGFWRSGRRLAFNPGGYVVFAYVIKKRNAETLRNVET